MLPPRRRRLPLTPRTSPPSGEPAAGEAFRPTATGAFSRYRTTPAGAAPLGALPDAIPIVRDEDSEAPQGGVL